MFTNNQHTSPQLLNPESHIAKNTQTHNYINPSQSHHPTPIINNLHAITHTHVFPHRLTCLYPLSCSYIAPYKNRLISIAAIRHPDTVAWSPTQSKCSSSGSNTHAPHTGSNTTQQPVSANDSTQQQGSHLRQHNHFGEHYSRTQQHTVYHPSTSSQPQTHLYSSCCPQAPTQQPLHTTLTTSTHSQFSHIDDYAHYRCYLQRLTVDLSTHRTAPNTQPTDIHRPKTAYAGDADSSSRTTRTQFLAHAHTPKRPIVSTHYPLYSNNPKQHNYKVCSTQFIPFIMQVTDKSSYTPTPQFQSPHTHDITLGTLHLSEPITPSNIKVGMTSTGTSQRQHPTLEAQLHLHNSRSSLFPQRSYPQQPPRLTHTGRHPDTTTK